MIESEGTEATVRNDLVREPPFLVKQQMIPSGGEAVTTLTLRRPVGD